MANMLYILLACLSVQMVYTSYVKLRILHYHFQGLKPYTIARVLEEKGVKVSRFGVHMFIQHYSEYGSIDRKTGSGRLSKVITQVKQLVDQQMENDDETTAYQLHHMFIQDGIQISFI